jgi:hypothetical protein
MSENGQFTPETINPVPRLRLAVACNLNDCNRSRLAPNGAPRALPLS